MLRTYFVKRKLIPELLARYEIRTTRDEEGSRNEAEHNGNKKMVARQCGFHTYMESWELAVDNPYYAVTGEDGRFEITDIEALLHLFIGSMSRSSLNGSMVQ